MGEELIPMKIEITVCENGIVIKSDQEGVFVFEDKENPSGPNEYHQSVMGALCHLCYDVFSGMSGDKFAKERITIKLETGEDYEDNVRYKTDKFITKSVGGQ